MMDPLASLERLDSDAMAPCVMCRRQLIETETPVFYRVSVQQCGIDGKTVRRQVGLAMVLGGGRDGLALAGILGPQEKPVVVIHAHSPVNICNACITACPPLMMGLESD
jgi:hypothetical protein